MPFKIIRNDITKVKADAIVNTANPEPAVGGGCDRAVYQAAGEKKLLAARKTIGPISPGEAAYTKAYRLKAKYIIHTVSTPWIDGKHGEGGILRSCYRKSFRLAEELGCKSIAFPLMASGTYRFPKELALQTALSAVSGFLLSHEMDMTLVVFDRAAFELSGKLSADIEQFIDEHAVDALRELEYLGDISGRRGRLSGLSAGRISAPEERDLSAFDASLPAVGSAAPDVSGKSLDEVIGSAGETFQEKLFELIDERGLDDVSVYKRANLDRKLFSSIRRKKNYRPKKKTAVALGIALHLDMDEMRDLLARAGLAFSPSSVSDLIISYFIEHGDYDIFEINAALFKYDQPVLGA